MRTVERCTECGVNLPKNPAGGLCYGCLGEPFPAEAVQVSLNGKRPVSLEEVHEAFSSALYLPDAAVVDVSLATVVANRGHGDPVWTMLVAPPSSGKTEVLRATAGLPEAYAISTLTAHTFASGMKGDRRASLLHRLDEDHKTLLVLKDFTSVLTMHREARAEILSQLREIYDGSFSKDFGTGQTVAWEGRLGLLAGVTPVVDNHRIVSALLGERFVYLRLPQEDRRALSRRALKMRDREHEMRERLRSVVNGFLDGIGGVERTLSEDATETVIKLSDLTTRLRSGVERDYQNRDILTMPEPEAPARFAKQVAALAAALMVIGYDEPGALKLVRRVADDSVPPARLRTMHLLGTTEDLSTPEVADGLGLPTTTTARILEDLTALQVAEREAGGGGPGGAHRWRLSNDARDLWNATRNVTPSHEKPPSTSTNTSPSLPLGDFPGGIRGSA
jgi:hypothetical protein